MAIAKKIKKVLHVKEHDAGFGWEAMAKTWLAAAMFFVPLVAWSWTNDPWEINKTIVLLVAVSLAWICFGIATLRRQTILWNWSLLDWLAISILIVTAVATVASQHVWQSIVGLSGWQTPTLPVVLAGVSLYVLTGQLYRDRQDRFIGWVSIAAGLGVGLMMQVFQFSGLSVLPPSFANSPIFSVFGSDLSDVAILAALFSAGALLLWPQAKEQWAKWSIIAAVAIGWFVLLILGRPVGWAVFALGMILVVLSQARQGKKGSMQVVMAAVIIAAAGMIAQFTNLHTKAGIAPATDVRLDQQTSAAITWKTLQSQPLIGSGPVTWYNDFVSNRPLSFNSSDFWSTRFIKAGSAWWETVATLGVIGTILWLAFALSAILMLYRAWTATNRPELGAAVLIVATFFITGFFTSWSFVLMTLFWAALGLSRSLVEPVASKPRAVGPGAIAGLSVLALLLVGFWFPAGSIFASEIMVRQAQVSISTAKPLSTIRTELRASLQLNSRNGLASVLLAQTEVAQAEASLQQDKKTEAEAAIRSAVQELQLAITRDPKNPAIYEEANNVLNRLSGVVSDADTEARNNFQTLRQLEPTNPIHDVGYGQTLMVTRARLMSSPTGDPEQVGQQFLTQALAAYDAALQKKPDYLQARFARAQALVEAGQGQAAITDLAVIDATLPNSASVWQLRGRALEILKQDTEAVAAYEKSLELDPLAEGTYLSLSAHYQTAGDAAKAKATIQRGIEQIPTSTALKAKLEELSK